MSCGVSALDEASFRWVSGFAEEQSHESIFDGLFGGGADGLGKCASDLFDRAFEEVTDHGFDVAAVVADFGVLGGFDFAERRIGEVGESSGDFGFADAGGSDHDDVLGCDFPGEIGVELSSSPSVADGDGGGAFGVILADDVAVEFGDDFTGREFGWRRDGRFGFDVRGHACRMVGRTGGGVDGRIPGTGL